MTGTKTICRLIYSSARSMDCKDECLAQIMKSSLWKNEELNVTGILLHNRTRFLQVLEGSKSFIEELYESIKGDMRHGGLSLRYFEKVNERHFSDWHMALVDTSKIKYYTFISEREEIQYRKMLNADISDYSDDGMRMLKSFIATS